VASIVADVKDQPGSLPLLQYALTELFERRQGNRITYEAYRSLGGLLGVLGRRAEETFAGLEQGGQATARQLFLRLVALGEGTEDTRRRALRSELDALRAIPAEEGGAEMEAVIEAFGRIRLLSFDRDPLSNTPTVEVAHEALLREWGRLREWLEGSRADLHQQRQLASAAREWHDSGKERSYLLVEQRLALFENWAQTTSLALTGEEEEFLQASIKQRQAQQQAEQERRARERRLEQRSRLFLRVLAVVLLLAAFGGFGLAYTALRAQKGAEAAQQTAQAEAFSRATQEQRALLEVDLRATQQAIAEQEKQEAENQRQIAEQQKQDALYKTSLVLVSQALKELEGNDPERAVLLALDILEIYPYTPQAESVLAQAAQEVYPYFFLDNYTDVLSDKGFDIAWSPDGKTLAQSQDELVILWDMDNRTLPGFIEFTWQGGSKIAWSPDGEQIATGLSRDSFIVADASDVYSGRPRIWDAGSAMKIRDIAGITTTHSLDWSPEGLLLTSQPDGRVIAYDASTGKPVLTLVTGQASVNDARWSPYSKQIATASQDGSLIVWDAQTGAELFRLEQNIISKQISWSPDGELLATFDRDGSGLVWDIYQRTIRFKVSASDAGLIQALTWSGEGRMLITAGQNGSVHFWDSATGYERFHLHSSSLNLTGIAFSPVTNRLAASNASNSQVQIWDLTPKTAAVFPSLEPAWANLSLKGMPWDLTWSPDGTRLAGGGIIWDAASGKKLVKLWDAREMDAYEEPQLLVSLQEALAGRVFQKGPVLDATGYAPWSPDGSLYVARMPNPDSNVDNAYIWDMKTFKRIGFVPDGAWLFGWSPDGTKVAVVNAVDGIVHVYDSRTFQETASLGDCISCNNQFPRWSPDGSRMVIGYMIGYDITNPHFDILDANTGAKLVELPSQDGSAFNGAWSPDGESLAMTYEKGVVKIWDTATWQVKVTFAGHTGTVRGVSWSPDGKRLVSSDDTGQVKVWNASDGQEVMSLTGTNGVGQVHWSPDGTMISAAGSKCFPIIHQAWTSTEDLIAYVKANLVWRELKDAERLQFGLPEKK